MDIACDIIDGEQYDIDLAIDISEGLREKAVPGTPENYVKIYTECWDNEPDNRPIMSQVVDQLNSIIANLNKTKDEKMKIDNEANLQSLQSSAQHRYSSSVIASSNEFLNYNKTAVFEFPTAQQIPSQSVTSNHITIQGSFIICRIISQDFNGNLSLEEAKIINN
ncbi:11534_t:CDS:2 [Funneliformis geosporum]|uniref:11534_t:CDS:1 n=1 Tax=Funneliformis geosporum TaxID=1117311 RepID=A0A9W4WTN9_9GLOM|nr:11534_t:CDS:2 [Funneliformis geosporum]